MRMKANFRDYMVLTVALALLTFIAVLTSVRIGAFDWGDLSVKGIAAAYRAGTYGDEVAMEYIKECNSLHPGAIAAEELEFMIDQGHLTGYVDELKSLGYIGAGYTPPGSSTSASSPESAPVPGPESFSVTDMEDTPMWATQNVNYRSGASTDYDKLGSLEQHEQVIVNGVASTGWYRFNKAEGVEAYVSNHYLTAEDPSNRELNIYNEETGQVDTYTFENADPDAIDEAIEVIKEEYAAKEPVVEEKIPEEVVEVKPVVEDPPEEVVEEVPHHSWQVYVSIISAIVCVAVIGIGIYFIIRNKKRGRTD